MIAGEKKVKTFHNKIHHRSSGVLYSSFISNGQEEKQPGVNVNYGENVENNFGLHSSPQVEKTISENHHKLNGHQGKQLQWNLVFADEI